MKAGPAGAGRTAVSPVLIVTSVEEEVAFLETVFQAQVGMLMHNAQGEAQQAEAVIGDSILVLERASATHRPTHSVLRVAMSNVQAVCQLALENGGETVPLPVSGSGDQGEAAVSDPQGNTWRLVTRNLKPSNEEVQRRLAEQRRNRL